MCGSENTGSSKTHKGKIQNWSKYPAGDNGLGFAIMGVFVDHPQFGGKFGHTSYVISIDNTTGEIETRNSKYTLVPPPDSIEALAALKQENEELRAGTIKDKQKIKKLEQEIEDLGYEMMERSEFDD